MFGANGGVHKCTTMSLYGNMETFGAPKNTVGTNSDVTEHAIRFFVFCDIPFAGLGSVGLGCVLVVCCVEPL